MYRTSQLQNGLTVATAEMPHMTSVSIGVWVGIGSRYEPPRYNGVCHFIEHMLFKGTPKRSAKEISQAIEGLGGYLNAFTAEETTCFHARAGYQQFAAMLEVLMDMYLNSTFDPEEIEKERHVIKEEIAMYADEPQHHVQELLNTTIWPEQPLGRPITGTAKTLDHLARPNLRDYLQQNYVGSNTLIVAAGRVRHAHVLKAVRPYARRIPNGGRPPFAPAQNSQSSARVCLFTKEVEQTQIALGVRTCSRHDERRYALRLLNAILGENMSSRLFQALREDRGLAYSIYSIPTFFHDTGDLVISAGLETGHLTKALRLILRELDRLKKSTPSRGELARACDYVVGQMELNLESTENQMNWLGEQLLGFGKIIRPAEIKRRLRQTTPAEIRSASCYFFRPERLSLALISPVTSTRHLSKVILS